MDGCSFLMVSSVNIDSILVFVLFFCWFVVRMMVLVFVIFVLLSVLLLAVCLWMKWMFLISGFFCNELLIRMMVFDGVKCCSFFRSICDFLFYLIRMMCFLFLKVIFFLIQWCCLLNMVEESVVKQVVIKFVLFNISIMLVICLSGVWGM